MSKHLNKVNQNFVKTIKTGGVFFCSVKLYFSYYGVYNLTSD